MIPRIIHYCWFGGGKRNSIVKKCIASYSKLHADEVIEWNESNCTFDENQYVREAYSRKSWAFVSDYYRLKALYEYGGIYLDTDVEIKKDFDNNLLDADVVLGYMFDCYLSTAVIMATPHHPFIKGLLDWYDIANLEISPNNGVLTDYVLRFVSDFKLNGSYCEFQPHCFIYPKEYFEAPIIPIMSRFNRGGYSVHHFTGFWIKQHGIKTYIRPIVKNILFRCSLLNYIYNLYSRKKSLRINPLYMRYLHDSKKK